MNLNELTDKEVQNLIARLKEPKNILSYAQINHKISAMFGKIDLDEAIIDTEDIEYILRVYRGRIEPDRFSISLRFKDNNQHLVRVDINPSGRHKNPDGTIITDSHIHIYSSKYPKRDAVAHPINFSDFPNVKTIADAFFEFEKFNHIKGRQAP